MKETALKYFESGLSTIPVGSDKLPRLVEGGGLYAWGKHQKEAIKPNGIFDKAYGIALAGGVNGTVCFDIDIKYDLTGTLYERLKVFIEANCPGLLKKMVVQKTQNKGVHFIYKCKKVYGNQKLARRSVSDEEKKINPDEKFKDLIEIRGQGGYFVVAPTPNYEIIYGSLTNIQEITEEEQEILFDCARTFNEVFDIVKEKNQNKKVIENNKSPFEAWNEDGDVLGFLEDNGWKSTMTRGSKNLMLRPGGTGKWSADWDSDKRLFYVFSTSTEFESEKAYNPVQVLTKIKFNGDFSEAAIWLLKNGYGISNKDFKDKKNSSNDSTIEIEKISELTVSVEEADKYLNQVRDGSFIVGLSTGIPTLDEYWRLKPANLDIINGHDNVGKSVIFWYIAVLSAKIHGWRWAIHHAENKTGGVKRKLIEFACCKSLKDIKEPEYSKVKKWVEDHFLFLIKNDAMTYKDYLNLSEKLILKEKFNALLLDPYNSLFFPMDQNRHEWDLRAVSEMRTFIDKTGASVYLNCHAVTDALRRKFTKEHEYYGYPMPPEKADTEGGGKFSNRADNFMTVHRFCQHPTEWMITQIHVRKIKETETGGHHTPMDSPVKLKSIPGAIGFETMDGFNPITNILKPVVAIQQRLTEPEKKDNEFNPPF